MKVVVSAAARQQDAFLFVRQTYGSFKGQWSFPSGYVDPGEDADAAAIRETMEEANVAVTVSGVMSVTMLHNRGEPMLYVVFLCEHISGIPQPDGIENDGAGYFTLPQIDNASEPFEAHNTFLMRRVLAQQAVILQPVQIADLHEMYVKTFA